MSEKDTFKTINKAGPEVLFKDRGSKFFGYAFPIQNEEEAKEHLDQLKKQHHNARHWCYAWQLGKNYEHFRANDDGEPSNSAGMPILGQLQSFELTNTLVVVVRYFGGTKLGVGGLIQAYKTTANLALAASTIVERTIDDFFEIKFDYPEMNVVMRIIKEEGIDILDQKLNLNCSYLVGVRKKNAPKVFDIFENTYKVEIKKVEI